MLSQVAEITMGQSPKAEDVNDTGDGLPLLNGPTEFGDTHPYPVQFTTKASKVCQQGDLLFCVRGSTTGRMNWADQPYAIGRGIAAIRHKKSERMQPFLRGVIEYELRNLLAHATGSTFPNVSSAMLARVDWPKLGEDAQQNASDCLALLDRNIRQLRGMSRTLEDIARAVFRSWFIDFEPIRAKAAGANSFRGMPQELFDSLPAAFEKHEFGQAPSGWSACVLSDLVEVNPSRILKKGVPSSYLEMSNVPNDGASVEVWAEREFSSGMRFKNGDTLLARITPCLENGKTALVDFLADEEIGWGSTEFIVLAPKAETPSEFIYCLARDARFRAFAIKNMTGTSGRQRVDQSSIAGFGMAHPGSALLDEFGRFARPLFKRIGANRDEITTLSELRDTLLPKLISGELAAPSLEALGLKAVGDGG